MDVNYPRHIVAAGVLVVKGPQVLLVRTPRRGWEIPGGQIEEGESILQGLRREVREEANVEVEIGGLAGVYSNLGEPVRVIMDFLGTWISGEVAPGDETVEAVWVDRGAVLERVSHPVYKRRIQHLLNFSGRVAYQAYTHTSSYQVHEERYL